MSAPAAKAGREEIKFPGDEDPSTRNLRSQQTSIAPPAPLPILQHTSRQSQARKDSSQPGIGGWENKLRFQLWHVGACSCQTRRSVCGWVGGYRCCFRSRQSRMCSLPAVTGRIAVNYFSGLVYIVYGVTSQNDIWFASLKRAEEHREMCREKAEKGLMNFYFCHWVFAPERNRKARKSIHRMRYG